MSHAPKSGIRRWFKGLFLKRVHHMITCREFEGFVLRYLEDELSDRQRSVFEWHLRLCRECREYLAAYERTLEVAGSVPTSSKDTVPQDVPEDLIRAILDARER